MITFLEGLLDHKGPTHVVMNVQGVGYRAAIPLSSYDRLPKEGSTCRLLTYHYVREDTEALYGFITEDERALFELLLGVSGIGPKLAIGMLSGLSPRDLKAAVVEGDVKRLSSVSGVGKKTAERVVIDLRDKLSEGEALEAVAGDPEGGAGNVRIRDAVLALISLGYKQAEAHKMVRQVPPGAPADTGVEELVRLALTGK